MTLKEFTIDLADAPAELEDAIEQNEQAEEKLLEKVAEEYPGDPESPDQPSGFMAAPDHFEAKFYELREQRAELQSRKARIEEFLDEDEQAGDWSHYQFTFKELSTEDALFIQGRSQAMAEEAEKRGEKIPGEAFGVSRLLERVRVDAPPEAPDSLAGSLPQQVGDWLLDELNKRTTEGVDEDLGNTSPQEALMSYKNSQQSSTTDLDDQPERSH